MNNKSRDIIRIILGGWLVYLGIRILIQVIQNEPSDQMIMAVLAVLFIIIGGGYAAFSVRSFVRAVKSEMDPAPGMDETQEIQTPNPAEVSSNVGLEESGKRNHVQMQQIGPDKQLEPSEQVGPDEQIGPDGDAGEREVHPDGDGEDPDAAPEGAEEQDKEAR